MEKVMQRRSEGFTLIELMIVVAIIGILAAVAVPQMTKYFDRANASKIKSAVAAVNNEIAVKMVESQGKTLAEADIKKIIVDQNVIGKSVSASGLTLTAGNVEGVVSITTEGSIQLDTLKNGTTSYM